MNNLFIMNKAGDQFYSLEHISNIYVGDDGCTIKVITATAQKMGRLGTYKSRDMACAVLADLYDHVAIGGLYSMPSDERVQELIRATRPDNANQFANNGKKPIRHGGS